MAFSLLELERSWIEFYCLDLISVERRKLHRHPDRHSPTRKAGFHFSGSMLQGANRECTT
jgi:hypothetical protein